VADETEYQPGQSGVFRAIGAIVEGARKFKRAVTGGESEPNPGAHELGEAIAQAFVAGRLADVHAMTTTALQERTACEDFITTWQGTITERGPLTGFDISDIGAIDLGFIPGLEEVPQDQFVAFLELTFSNPTVTLDDANALVVAAVVLDQEGELRIGALHTR
jgi:hypothetical protein